MLSRREDFIPDWRLGHFANSTMRRLAGTLLTLLPLVGTLLGASPGSREEIFSAEEKLARPSSVKLESDADRFDLIRVFGYGWGPVDYSPDGRHIASAGASVVFLLDAQTYQIERQLFAEDTMGTMSVQWSPDGHSVAAASFDPPRVHIWDAATGELRVRLQGLNRPARSIAWSPEGSRLAACGANEIRIWDVKTEQILRTLSGNNSVAWSPDGRYVVTGFDEVVRIYAVETGQLVRQFERHRAIVQTVAWSPDGRYVASSGSAPFDLTVKVWEVETGLLVWTLPQNGGDAALAWSPNGAYLAAGSGSIKIWGAKSGQLVRSLGEGQTLALAIRWIAWSPDSARLVSGGGRVIRLWDVTTGDRITSLPGHSGTIESVAWSPEGRYIASAATDYLLNDRSIRIWDKDTGEPVRVIRDDICRYGFRAVDWSPDGKYLASVLLCDQPSIVIWETATGTEWRRWSGLVVYSVAWSPDGRYLAWGALDRKIRILEVDRWEIVKILADPMELGSSIAWSPDGRYLACRAGRQEIWIFEADTWEIVSRLPGRNHADFITWSADGQYLASRDGSSFGLANLINIWEFKTGELIRSLEDIQQVRGLAWSPNGRYLAAAEVYFIPSIKIWEVETGQMVARLLGHTDVISSVQWSPDGNYLASGSWDSSVRLWGVRTSE
ncbi:MAG: WD40 repeat domain-containing protein [Acidobacteria bacterium]|nr:WD40 repeat domain-containing protein [Acidobacteriota bacterium]MBI3658630.1 WD40 repeat domain-containing protein [Acidobacteriota bacterium]